MPLRPHAKIPDGITVQEFFNKAKDQLKLTLVAGEAGLKRHIRDKTVNRPALAVTGYFRNFASRRVQLFGAGEMGYLKDHSEEALLDLMRSIVACTIPCMFVSRNLVPFKAMLQAANESRTPLFRSQLNSRDLTNMMTILLEQEFAPKISEHGTLMDVRGIGTLIRGKSGVGKSECALALIERGHSLVADDLVYIRQVNEVELIGRSSDLNRGYMECRGIGIINIAELFGIRAVRMEKTINLVVTFAEWTHGMDEERTGLEQDYFKIMDVPVPHIILPVRPGRDLARLVEVASMVQALKMLGHDSAKEFNDRLIQHMTQS